MTASDSNQEPDWSRLPADPAGFFELPPEFDRKALKRKYNQFIRRYKPEQHPQEFQKIRAAYEWLDGQARYGTSSHYRPVDDEYQWDQPAFNSPAQTPRLPEADRPEAPQPRRATRPIAPPLHERARSESPLDLFTELTAKSSKSPFDFFAMALIGDIVSNDPLIFFRLLLTGIQQHPGERGLFALMFEYLRQHIPTGDIPTLLKTMAGVVDSDQYFYLTEPLWDQLLRERNFALWKKTLTECESTLNDSQFTGRIAFYIHVIPAAIWSADKQWILDRFEFLEEYLDHIPPDLEMDFELLYQLREYTSSPGQTDDSSKKIHQAILDYFCRDEVEGDKAVIRCQTEFAQNASSLLNSFGPDSEYSEQQFVIWDVINEEVCQRHNLFSIVDPRNLRARIFSLLDDLNRSEFARFKTRDELHYRLISWGPYVAAAVLPSLLLMFLPWHSVVFALVGVLIIASILWVKFRYKPDEKYNEYIAVKMANRYYSEWRGRFVHVFEATQITHAELSDALVEVIQEHQDKIGFAWWLYHFLPGDAGLHLFASASRYMR